MTEVFTEKISLADTDDTYSETMLSLFWGQGMKYIRTAAALPHFLTEPRDPNLGPRTQKGDGALNGDLEYSKGHPATRSADTSKSPLSSDLSSDLAAQVRLREEAWLNAAYLSWGSYGCPLRQKPPASFIDGKPEIAGTLLFVSPRLCPTTFSTLSGPVSPDMVALTNLHYNALEVDGDMPRVLIVTVLHELALRGVPAVETLGCSGTTDSMSALIPSSSTSDNGTENPVADFEAQLGEKLDPKPCISDSLTAINHNAGDLTRTRAPLDSGFRVMTPYPIHPKFRIEPDAELDRGEEIGHTSDLGTKESFIHSKLFSLQRRIA